MTRSTHTAATAPLPRWINLGFVIAAAFNFGIIVVSRGFAPHLGAVDSLFSPAGCALVVIWGLAYLSVARTIHLSPHIAAVFCLEKLLYGVAWVRGLMAYGETLHQQPFDIAVFYQTYGVADFGFAVFFALVWWRLWLRLWLRLWWRQR